MFIVLGLYNFGDRLNHKADIIPLILQEFFIDKEKSSISSNKNEEGYFTEIEKSWLKKTNRAISNFYIKFL